MKPIFNKILPFLFYIFLAIVFAHANDALNCYNKWSYSKNLYEMLETSILMEKAPDMLEWNSIDMQGGMCYNNFEKVMNNQYSHYTELNFLANVWAIQKSIPLLKDCESETFKNFMELKFYKKWRDLFAKAEKKGNKYFKVANKSRNLKIMETAFLEYLLVRYMPGVETKLKTCIKTLSDIKSGSIANIAKENNKKRIETAAILEKNSSNNYIKGKAAYDKKEYSVAIALLSNVDRNSIVKDEADSLLKKAKLEYKMYIELQEIKARREAAKRVSEK